MCLPALVWGGALPVIGNADAKRKKVVKSRLLSGRRHHKGCSGGTEDADTHEDVHNPNTHNSASVEVKSEETLWNHKKKAKLDNENNLRESCWWSMSALCVSVCQCGVGAVTFWDRVCPSNTTHSDNTARLPLSLSFITPHKMKCHSQDFEIKTSSCHWPCCRQQEIPLPRLNSCHWWDYVDSSAATKQRLWQWEVSWTEGIPVLPPGTCFRWLLCFSKHASNRLNLLDSSGPRHLQSLWAAFPTDGRVGVPTPIQTLTWTSRQE